MSTKLPIFTEKEVLVAILEEFKTLNAGIAALNSNLESLTGLTSEIADIATALRERDNPGQD